eukprot:COSAG06_NODE_43674_length_370_cov_0.483395_1_plen_37_part_10
MDTQVYLCNRQGSRMARTATDDSIGARRARAEHRRAH